MATFKERYEELFGPTSDYDPVEIADEAPRRAINIQANAPTASPRRAIPMPPSPPVEEQGAISGLLKGGLASLGEGLLGIPEYGARQLELTRGTFVEENLNRSRQMIADWREGVYSRMNPEVLDSKGREFLTLDPDRTIWKGGPVEVAESILYKLTEQVPMTVATLLPGGLAIRAGATARGISYLGASEAGLSLGFIQNEIADGIAELSSEELTAESPRFAQLLEQYGEDEARSRFTAEAQGAAPVIGGLLVGAVSAAAGRYLKPTLTGEIGANFGQRFRRGAVSEGLLQEGPQESLEQIVGNIAAAAYDGDREALEGAAEAFVQGAAVGGPMGGTFAGVFGQSEQASPESEPEATPPPAPAESFEDVFGTGGESPFIAPDQAPVAEDVAAAVSANIREGALMDDMIDNLNFGQAEAQRAATGQPTTPTEQGELFPTAAPNTGPGVLVPPESPAQPEQQTLPLQLRERGRPPLPPAREQMPDDPQPEPQVDIQAQLDALESGERGGVYLAPGQQVAADVSRYGPVVENFDGRGGDVVFRDEATAQEAIAARDAGEDMQAIIGGLTGAGDGKPLGGNIAVQQLDENGGVRRESLVETEEQAERLAEFWGGNTQIIPAYEAVERRRQELTRENATRDMFEEDQQPSERLAAQAEQAAAAPTEGQQAVREATAALPFEEGAQLRADAAPASTRAEAAERLVGSAAEQLDSEAERAIGGFFPPASYEFTEAKNRERYTRVWDQLLDTEIALEQQPKNVAGRRGELTQKRKKLLETLAKIRQIDRPRRTAQRKVEVASKVDRSTVRTLRRNASKIAKKIDTTTEALPDLPEMDRAKVDSLTPLDLDVTYEQAIRYLEGQDQRFDSEGARKARSPSVKRKLILRALNKRRNRAETESRVKGTRLATKSSQGVATESLTSVTQKADESKADVIKRKKRAREAYKVLGGTVKKVEKRVNAMEVERDFEGDITPAGRQTLLAKSYTTQLMQLARSVMESQQNDRKSIEFAESLGKMLEDVSTASEKRMANLMKKQQRLMDEFVARRGGTEGRTNRELTTRQERAAMAMQSEEKMQAFARKLERDKAWKKDSIMSEFVKPIMDKVNGAYFTRQGYYTPTAEESAMLNWALEQWAKDIPAGHRENFYKPISEQLRRTGFTVEDGQIKLDDNQRAIVEPKELKTAFDKPAMEIVGKGPQFITKEGVARRQQDLTGQREQRESRELQEDAPRHVLASQIFAKFRRISDNKKSTISRLVTAEKRMLEELREGGFVVREGSALATIRVPGRKDLTYRKAAADLEAKRINKADARRRMSSIRKSHTTPLARFQTAAPDVTAPDLDAAVVEEVQVLENTDFTDAAGTLGDLLQDRNASPDATSVIDRLAEVLPADSIYGVTARKLQQVDLSDVTVRYDTAELGNTRSLGRFSPRRRSILLNYNQLVKLNREGDLQLSNRALHVFLHEAMHAATQESLRLNGTLRQSMDILRGEARRAWQEANPGQPLPYGLSVRTSDGKLTPVDEFVAEFFSNPEIQDFAKTVDLGGIGRNESLWQRFKGFVKELLGWQDADGTIFDVMMEMESRLFQYADRRSDGPDLNLDMPLGRVANEVRDKIAQTLGVEDRLRNVSGTGARFLGNKILNAVTTMRQLRERYGAAFSDGSLNSYMTAFDRRNSKNSELMQLPEKLSRRWTEATDSNPEASLEFSRVATEATIHSIDPSKPARHERNADSAAAQPERYRELKKRYDALPDTHKKLWADVTKFYSDSLRRETNLMLLNAIRGVVTQGNKNSLPIETFNRKYNVDNISQFDTQEKIANEFGEYLGDKADDLVSLIQQLSQVPQMKQGVYFPLMRYGDWAVYAKSEREPEYHPDSAAANAAAAAHRAEDPTLTIGVKREDDGRYSVRVTESAFITGESAAEVEQKREELVGSYDDVGDVGRKLSVDNEASINTNQALSSILGTLENNPAAQQAIKQFYLRSLADSSFRKREIRRQNRRGVDFDTQHRNFANYAKQSAYYQSQLEYGWQMAKGLNDMRSFLKDYTQTLPSDPTRATLDSVYETLKQRDELMRDPQRVSDIVRGGVAMTQFWMLTSASYHMINSTQPWMVTLPTMAGKFGWGNAFSAMKVAQSKIKAPIFKQIGNTKGGFAALPWLKHADVKAEQAFGVFDDLTKDLDNPDHVEMLNELRKSNVLEVSPLTELREIADGQTSKWSKTLDASRIMAHLVEVNNRVLTSIAAYDLMYQKQIADGAGRETAKAEATKYAEDMVSQTQFDYSTANKPPVFMRYPLLFQFMQWSQHIYAHLIRNVSGAMRGDKEARSALLGVLGTHAAVGGLVGVTLQPIKMAFGMAMMALGDDDEPYTLKNALSGATFDRLMAQTTNDLFGTTASTVLTRGVPAAIGADLSTRMSMGTLYFVDVRPDTAESLLGSLGASFGGAFLNQLLSFYGAAQKIGSGDWQRGIEQASPKLLRDIIRAGRFATDGLVNNSGDTVLDTSDLGFVDVALQAIGFTPTTTSEFYQGQAAIKDVENYVRQRRTRLLKDFRTASPSERSRVLVEIREFNQAYPEEVITRSTLLRNIQSKAEREGQYRRYGAAIDDRRANLYEGYGEPYR